MKFRYSKYTGDELDGIDLEEVLSKLSDLLLSSGFGDAMDDEGTHSMQSLHDAVLEALLNGGMLSDTTLWKLLGKDWQNAEDAEQRIDELVRRIIERLQHQGYLTSSPQTEAERNPEGQSGAGEGMKQDPSQ